MYEEFYASQMAFDEVPEWSLQNPRIKTVFLLVGVWR
jgi:hypothetical protein